MKTKHLALSIAAVVMIALLIVFTLLTAESASASEGNSERSIEQVYPVVLPNMSLIGLTATCDGTVDGRRNTLANLWEAFGATKALNNDPAIYRQKIYVVFYGHQPNTAAYSIFIGYGVISWLQKDFTIDNKSIVMMDFPKGNYYGLDIRGTSTNSIIKGWNQLYNTYPNDISHRAMEIYTLDSDNYSVQNVTLYLKKQ
ncbi:MAG: GyrI-like domain-containing protein [Rikenellaceae bacterium]